MSGSPRILALVLAEVRAVADRRRKLRGLNVVELAWEVRRSTGGAVTLSPGEVEDAMETMAGLGLVRRDP